jgi:hypothetical protein
MNRKEMEKFMLGRTWEEATRIPTAEESLRRMSKRMRSKHDLLSLGVGTEGNMWITEEERENHLSILGSTGEGKSRFLELMLRYDVDNGNPFLLLDSSAGGATAKDKAKYFASKGNRKVIYYNPAHLFSHKRVLGLNPFIYDPSLEDACVANVLDTIKVIFNTKDGGSRPFV